MNKEKILEYYKNLLDIRSHELSYQEKEELRKMIKELESERN